MKSSAIGASPISMDTASLWRGSDSRRQVTITAPR
jgi:hypothetical protein